MATDDYHAITSVLTSLIEAWGQHDAEAYGAQFTIDATYVTYIGTCYSGRPDIVKSHRALFQKFLKGTRLADEITSLRFFGLDTAIVTSRGDTYKSKQPKKLTKVQTYTFVRQEDGQWRIAAFQNTRRKSLMEAVAFKLLPETIPSGSTV
ncbi:SgcJ/EcaC family oxidoreductase [Salinisphaera sp.]|uniref:SgcJ/EcaC family oxidoreductase n=1 Tax=Salinisphaera sp. TaxID=1914330 RepID=UPI002D78C8FD|nr:SgcJ/EcaC family oxidoreductase [Salinisphaera sp.]HET7315237.1 SgcJ/EcaC family oxidoreductase [Salinisphaera sp.]